ncbi:MAG: hypothetical protein MK110_10920 [Fuerstiella sp.]|nr:hypothetical protein [Fuerstiella sp.]
MFLSTDVQTLGYSEHADPFRGLLILLIGLGFYGPFIAIVFCIVFTNV